MKRTPAPKNNQPLEVQAEIMDRNDGVECEDLIDWNDDKQREDFLAIAHDAVKKGGWFMVKSS